MKLIGKIALALVGLIVLGAVGGWFAFRRADIPYETLEAQYAVPTSHYADLPGGFRAHYREDGQANAPVVLLVHGFGDSFLSWAGWIDVLSKDFRVITLDLPGHGLTRAPADFAPSSEAQVKFVGDLAAVLNLKSYAIAGSSMGGGVAWRTTLAYPENVWGLVLVDAAGWPNAARGEPPLAFKLLGTPVGRFLLETVETRPITTESLKANFVDKSIVTPAFVDRWVAVQRAPGHRPILMRSFGAAGGSATAEALSVIRAPTLVLWGDKDVLLDVASARKFDDSIPDAKLIVYPDVGHLPQLEIPARSSADALAFLRQVQPARPTTP